MVRAGDVIRASDVAVQACRLTHSTTQSIPDAALTVVTFDTELFDTDAMHSSGSPTRITINTAGIYQVGFHGSFTDDTGYVRLLGAIRLNGSTEISRSGGPALTASIAQTVDVQTVDSFDVGDYIEVQVYQDSTTAHTLQSVAERSPIFYAARLGS